ncbi:MAG: TetR/AcrR family transcriptional regulator [Phycisphaerales bacterium]
MPETNPTQRPPARERLLDAATELFVKHGVNNVGIDAIVEHAGVAKMSLYNHFASKDDLVAAALERLDDEWFAWLRATVERLGRKPADRPLAFFDALGEWFATPEFRGCPFLNTHAELPDAAHPARARCDAHATRLRAYLEDLLRDAGVARPGAVADDFALLTQGAVSLAAVTGLPDPAKRAKRLARSLLAK